MDWEEAGRGWGARAREWAYLFEPYSLPANELSFRKLEVETGTRLVDVACGSGFAARLAALKGAEVSGIDAAAPLIEIARLRSPEIDFRSALRRRFIRSRRLIQWHLERMRRSTYRGSPRPA